MKQFIRKSSVSSVTVEQVIVVRSVTGHGIDNDPVREVVEIYDMKGALLSRVDHYQEEQNIRLLSEYEDVKNSKVLQTKGAATRETELCSVLPYLDDKRIEGKSKDEIKNKLFVFEFSVGKWTYCVVSDTQSHATWLLRVYLHNKGESYDAEIKILRFWDAPLGAKEGVVIPDDDTLGFYEFQSGQYTYHVSAYNFFDAENRARQVDPLAKSVSMRKVPAAIGILKNKVFRIGDDGKREWVQ
jgi:hypothetical protein